MAHPIDTCHTILGYPIAFWRPKLGYPIGPGRIRISVCSGVRLEIVLGASCDCLGAVLGRLGRVLLILRINQNLSPGTQHGVLEAGLGVLPDSGLERLLAD